MKSLRFHRSRTPPSPSFVRPPGQRRLGVTLAGVVLGTLLLLAAGADGVKLLTGFGYDEMDPFLALAGPGAVGIPQGQNRQKNQNAEAAFRRLLALGDPDAEVISGGRGDDGVLRYRVLEAAHRSLLLLQGEFARQTRQTGEPCAEVQRVDPVIRDLVPVDIDGLDADGDGRICQDELVSGTAWLRLDLRDLERQDVDGDGALTQQEYLGPPVLARHWLGTDVLGRDVLVRWAYAVRVSMLVVLLAVGSALLVGSSTGLLFGYLGGWPQRLYLYSLDVLQAVPFFLVIVVLAVVVRQLSPSGAPGLMGTLLLFIALGAVSWFSLGRFAAAQASGLRQSGFVGSLRRMGYPTFTIVFRHLIPNLWMPLVGFGALLVPVMVLEEALLSFLGFGVQPPFPSIGILLNEGMRFAGNRPALLVVPGVTLLAITWSISVLAEELRGRIAADRPQSGGVQDGS